MPILSSLDNLLQDAYNIFQKSPGNFLESAQNTLNFGLDAVPP